MGDDLRYEDDNIDEEYDADSMDEANSWDRFMGIVDSDDDNMAMRWHDTTAAQARNGRDIQGIPWDRLQFTRENYRETRLQQYKNYINLNIPLDEIEQECKKVERSGKFYEFRHNTRAVESTIVHFQLRNLVWATSKHDVYLLQNYSVVHWSPLTRRCTEVINLYGTVLPDTETRNPFLVQLGRVQVSTMCVKKNLLVAGGFQGELVCKNLDQPGVCFSGKITYDENAITNAIEIFEDVSGATHILTSNNDAVVRVFDAEKFVVLRRFNFPWAVNHTSISPDGKMVVVVGDDADGLLADSQNGQILATLKGHLDFSFASAWHPNGLIFATGNQDMTCRLWDIRNLKTAFTVLKGHIGAIRSIQFTSDGRFMSMVEPADFVHIFDTRHDFSRCQEIDLFGEIAGVCFSPDDEALFIGVADRTYGSLLEFRRRQTNMYLDALI